MAAGCSKDMSSEEVLIFLEENIDDEIPIINSNLTTRSFIEDDVEIQVKWKFKFLYHYEEEDPESTKKWGKSLLKLPIFTQREVEKHRINSGKTAETAIIKTLERGQKFKAERYISADTIFSICDEEYFCFKGICMASMKKEKRNMFVALDIVSGCVVHSNCCCPAGKSGYCNHVMALLLEIADYSLHNYKEIPTEVACTS